MWRPHRETAEEQTAGSIHLNCSADVELPAEVATAVRRRRPDVDPGELVAAGWDQLHRQLDAYLDSGLTKFVIRPVGIKPLDGFIDRFVAELVGRQK